jgi:outer membrane protein OmpA-like peptidoglycan-associated protein
LGYPVNTDYLNEICPVVSFGEDILFFTRNADPACEKTLMLDGINIYNTASTKEYEENLKMVFSQIASEYIEEPLSSGYNQDIWYSRLKDGEPYGIFHPKYPINDVLPNSICANYGKSNTFLVINQFPPSGGIEKGFSYTNFDGETFTFPKPLHIAGFNQISSEINLTASIDSTILVLAMDDGNGRGMDLFLSFRSGDNKFTTPVNLGNEINSEYRESTPMLSHDMKRIYFSSDRPGGYGGTDIYFSERKDASFMSWTKPELLNPPLNSEYNDSHPHLLKDNNTIFFTSDRGGTSDIYRAKLKREKLTGSLIVNIKVINMENGQAYPAEISWGNAYQYQKSGFFNSKDGICRYKFFENKSVVFQATNRNLVSREVIVDPQDLANAGLKETSIELILNPEATLVIKSQDLTQDEKPAEPELQIKNNIILHSIYFEKSKPDLLPESYPEVQKLVKLMKSHPLLNISIAGHTDNVGEKFGLIKLSEERAKTIKNYLIEGGIAAFRVTALGYGDSKPLAPNDTEENKSKNRRVEIRIVGR